MHRIAILIAIWGSTSLAGLLPMDSAAAQTWRSMTSARQVWDEGPVDVEIGYGAGNLTIEPAEAPLLYRMELRYNADAFEPEIAYDEEDRELRLGIRSLRDGRRTDLREGSRATISLSREVPLDLDLEFGAGEANIELGDMSLRNLSISTGASDTDITFSAPNRIAAEEIEIQAGAADLRVIGLGHTRAARVEFEGGVGATVLDFSGASQNMTASVEMGVGAVTLRLPRSQGVRINRESFLSSFDATGLDRRDDSYFSANWGRAPTQLVIDVSAAFGSIDVEWVD